MPCPDPLVGVSLRDLDPEWIARNGDPLTAIAADVSDEYWTVEHFLRDLPEKWRLSFAALDTTDAPIGYAVLSAPTPTRAHLHHFMAAPSWRGHGLGERMLNEAVRRCVVAGRCELTLKVGDKNGRAVAFYEKHGFAISGRDGLLLWMTRPLTKP